MDGIDSVGGIIDKYRDGIDIIDCISSVLAVIVLVIVWY